MTWSPPQSFPDLASAKIIAVDTETCDPNLKDKGPGFVRGDAYVCGISVGTDDGFRGYYPIKHAGGGNLDKGAVVRWLNRELSRDRQPKVGANLLYDLEGLHYTGIKVAGPVHDVLLAEPLLDENKLKYSLDSLAEEYLGEHKNDDGMYQWCADNIPKYNKNGKRVKALATRAAQIGNIWQAPAHVVGPYAESDVDLPLRILPLQLKRIEQEQLRVVYDLERDLLPLLLKMRVRGVRVNVPVAERLSLELAGRIAADNIAIEKLAGRPVNVWAAEDLAPLMDKYGIAYPRTAKTKQPSFAAEWFKVASHHPIVALVASIRKWEKFKTTFIDGYIINSQVKGRVHGQFHLLKGDENGTISGRMSSSGPNLQNVPARDEELGPMIRALFLPDEGEDWWSLDYSQIEYRVMAHYGEGASAQAVRDAYILDPTTDFHQRTADLSGETRKTAKTIGFGTSYGFGNQGLADMLGVALDEGVRLKNAFNDMVPFISRLSKDVANKAASHGYIRTILGRRAHFPFWESSDFDTSKAEGWVRTREEAVEKWGPRVKRARVFTAFNRLIQGGAADIYKLGLRKAYKSGLFDDGILGAPLSMVHDETNVSAGRDKKEAVMELKDYMETALEGYADFSVPLTVEAGTGANWAEAH